MTIKELNEKIEKINKLIYGLEKDKDDVIKALNDKIKGIWKKANDRGDLENTAEEDYQIFDINDLIDDLHERFLFIEGINPIVVKEENFDLLMN